LLSILCVNVAFTFSNGYADGEHPAQQVNLYLTVTASTYLCAATDTNLTVTDSGGSPTPGLTGPYGTIAPLPATSTTTTATSEFSPHGAAPHAVCVVDNHARMPSSESAIHEAEKAAEMMRIYEGAVGKIQLAINVVDTVVEVCTPSPLLSINGTTLAL